MENKPNYDAVFAVMGATGTGALTVNTELHEVNVSVARIHPGKSTFIRLLTNDEKISIGHNQESETFEILTANYKDQATGRTVMLIDTPGFDDSREGVTDTDILQKIVEYLEPENGERRKLNGVVYMHRISDPRVGGVSRKNLRMFHNLCGPENLKNVRIVTTNWGRVSEEEGNRREADLKNGAFKALIDAGAQMRRHANTLESARKIMSEIVPLEAVTMKIQEELRDGKKLADTSAGKVLTAEMQEMQKRHAREMADLRKEMELAAKANDHALRAELAQERKALEEKIARLEDDRDKLERTLDEVHKAEESRRHAESSELRQLMEQMMEDRRETQAHMAKALEHEVEFRKQMTERELELQRQLAEANRRMVDLAQRDSGGGCLIC